MKLQERIDELKQRMYALECSDDFLFSNRNGNLPTYKGYQDEVKTLTAELNALNNQGKCE